MAHTVREPIYYPIRQIENENLQLRVVDAPGLPYYVEGKIYGRTEWTPLETIPTDIARAIVNLAKNCNSLVEKVKILERALGMDYETLASQKTITLKGP